jgi:hypothetical protein
MALLITHVMISTTTAQRSSTKTFRELVDEQAIVIDSLNVAIGQLEDEKNAMQEASDKLVVRINELEMEVEQLKTDKGDLSQQLDGFYSDNLHLNQSNRILIAFNFLVGILLLISLVFFLRRLGKGKQQATDDIEKVAKVNDTGASKTVERNIAGNVHVSFEDKLQQLERLGSLKEKGVLTDEEFNAQKRTILD